MAIEFLGVRKKQKSTYYPINKTTTEEIRKMANTMNISYAKKRKIVVAYDNKELVSDFPVAIGGEDSALNPYQILHAALGACSAFYMREFFLKHKLRYEEASITADFELDAEGDMSKVKMNLHVGASFPEELKTELIETVKGCKVKKQLSPKIEFEYNII